MLKPARSKGAYRGPVFKHEFGHNFVVADKSCNIDKSFRLVGNEHLERWTRRNLEKADRLAANFTGLNINHDLPTTLKVAEHAYRHLRDQQRQPLGPKKRNRRTDRRELAKDSNFGERHPWVA